MNIIIQKVKTLESLLINTSTLFDIMIERRQNVPQIPGNLVDIILDLNNAQYQFTQRHYGKMLNHLVYNDWHNQLNETFLSHATLPEHKQIIEIVFNGIKMSESDFYNLRRITVETNNFNWLDILIEKNYLFTPQDLSRIFLGYNRTRSNKKRKIFNYNNTKLDAMLVLDNRILLYSIFKLNNNMTDEFYDKVLCFINNSEPIPIYYFDIFVNTINFYSETNKSKGLEIVTALFNNVIKLQSNHESITNIVCQKGLNNTFLCKLIIKYLYNDSFINLLLDKNLLHKNLDYLFDAQKYNVTTNLINKILFKSSICNITANNTYNLDKYVYDKKSIFTINKNVIIKFNYDSTNNFIEIGNEKFEYRGKINSIDLFKIFNCIPNDETFKIALNRGYINTIQCLINEYKFIVDDKCLLECMKSKNIDLINMILNYGVKPNKIMLESLITVPKSKMVYFSEELYKRHERMKEYRRKRFGTNKKSKSKPKSKIIKNSRVINIVELLIKYDLKIDFYCINLLLSCNEELLNLERFGICYDEDLYFLCYVNEYYPQEYMEKFIIDKNVLIMRKLMATNMKPEKITDFLNTNNLKLDAYSLESGIKNKNIFSSELMNKKLCIPSLPTLYKLSLCVGNGNYWRNQSYNCKLWIMSKTTI